MRFGSGVVISTLILVASAGCAADSPDAQDSNDSLMLGESFVTAFYSWQPDQLAALVAPGHDLDRVIYYQAWAEAGNYKIKIRTPCAAVSPGKVDCAITVTDDIGGTLGYIATDTFHLTFGDENIASVAFSSDDPPVLEEVFRWIGQHRPEVLSGVCKDMFAGGNQPKECVRAVIESAKRYVADASVPAD